MQAKRVSRMVKRTNSFTDDEIDVLVDLVCKHKVSIENALNSSSATRKRDTAWESVTKSVNAVYAGVMKRSVDNIRRKWAELKSDAQTSWTILQQSRSRNLQSGSGDTLTPTPRDLTDTEQKILDYIGVDLVF